MPRRARALSSTGIYHIMLRGINQQRIFEDSEDNEKFLEVLKDCKEISNYKIYAFCLMGNHLHLLMKVENETLEQIFKRIGGRYVYWYNAKYCRVGHLFQDRYKSEPVEDDCYFLAVLRYIHQNPVKAGLVNTIKEYTYSSYHFYMEPKGNQLVDIDLIMGMMSLKQFEEYQNEANDDICLDLTEQTYRMTDEQAKKIIYKLSKCKNISEFQNLEPDVRNKCVSELRASGLSVRQISRLTGISKGIVEKQVVQT